MMLTHKNKDSAILHSHCGVKDEVFRILTM